MAKARKKTRKTAKRSAKKTRRAKKTMAKSKARRKARKTAKPKAKAAKTRRAKAPQEGPIAEAVHAVVDTIEEAAALRRRLAGRETFED